jgi:hypothetical protein
VPAEKFFLVPGEKFCLLRVPVLVPGKKFGAAATLESVSNFRWKNSCVMISAASQDVIKVFDKFDNDGFIISVGE